uniref:Transmembrane protein 88 b n=1 Tax=Eptatretus burgeri TaxID=7764 RepID=A0A8C4R6R9_EPTBU
MTRNSFEQGSFSAVLPASNSGDETHTRDPSLCPPRHPSTSRTPRHVSVPPPYSVAGMEEPQIPREPLDCWACAVLLTAHNTCAALLNLLLLTTVFSLLLLPALIMVGFGLACHSRVFNVSAGPCGTSIDDNGSTVLTVAGFVLLSPLLVLALAAYCRLARRLRLDLCFMPYSRAVYKPTHPSTLLPPHPVFLCCCPCRPKPPDSSRTVWV